MFIVYFFFEETAEPTWEELAYPFEGDDTKKEMVQKKKEKDQQVAYEEHVEDKPG